MTIDPATERALRLFLEQVGEGYDVAGAYLYGSRARRTHRPDSDADVAILLRGEHQHFLHTKLALAGIA